MLRLSQRNPLSAEEAHGQEARLRCHLSAVGFLPGASRLSASQIAAFRALFQNNYRPVQPLNGRSFLLTAQQPPAVLPGTGGSASLVAGTLAGVCLLAALTRLGSRRRRPRIRRHSCAYSTLLSSK